MAEFVNPFSGVIPGKKLTSRELSRAIRLSLSAEQEAIHLYEALADATDNRLAATVLTDIANEEKVHVGEFLRLLEILLEDEKDFLNEGFEEVEQMRAGGTVLKNRDSEHNIPTVGDLKNLRT